MNEFIKKKKEILLLIILSCILLFPFFKGDYYENHDGPAHLARAAEYTRAFLDGQFIPRWAANLNHSYGSPALIIFYPLAGYLTAVVHATGFSLEHSFLLIGTFFFILGTVGFYLWMKRLFDTKTAFLASIFYSVLPYRFLTLYVRGGIGELVGYSLLPFLFYYIETLGKRRIHNILVTTFLYALIVISHNGISLIFTPIILLYSFLKGKIYLLNTFLCILLGLGLSAYFWIPSLIESKYTSFLLVFKDMYKDHFPSFFQLVYSPWGFGPDVNKSGGLSPQIGVFSFLVFIACVVLLVKLFKSTKKEKENKLVFIFFWVCVFSIGVFLSSSFSSLIWELSDFIKKFQFPWRFIVLSSFAAAALSPYIFLRIKNMLVLTLLLIALFVYTAQFIQVKKYVTQGNTFYYEYTGSSFFRGEATPIWTSGDPGETPIKPIELIAGQATFSNFQKKSNLHTFEVIATTPIVVRDNTLYFPGWQTQVDGKKTPIQFQDINHKGFITFSVPSGKHHVAVKFTESPVRMVSDIISLVTAISLISFGIYAKVTRGKKTEKITDIKKTCSSHK